MIHLPRRLLHRLQPSETVSLLGLAIAVGLATGFGVWIFRQGIEFFHELFNIMLGEEIIGHWLENYGIDPRLALLITLPLAGLIVGFIVHRFIGHERHHGVAGIMESVAFAGGRLPYVKMPFRALASMLSLGAGASVGPEDPSVQIGANLGSFFGQALRLSEDRVRLLVSSGAASAIAAAFNAPIAGVFFALEIILGEFNTRSFGIVVLSAVISSGFTRAVAGANPIFDGISVRLGDPLQLIFYAILGVLLAVIASLALRFYVWLNESWHHQFVMPLPFKTALTGLLVAIVGLFLPQILGPGESFMHEILIGEAHTSLGLLLLLAAAKLIMTAISSGGGFVGGVFAPTLFIGIMLGAAYGQFIGLFIPQATIGPAETFAIAGMAGMLSSIVRAPITAILLVFELTDDYALILPIMLTSVTCTLVIERIGPAGIYMLSLLKQGIRLDQGRDVDVMQGISVREAMKSPAPQIHKEASLRDLRDGFRAQRTRALCVVDDDGLLIGIATLGDLQRAFERAIDQPTAPVESLRVCDICTKDVTTVGTGDMLWTAIRQMGARDIGRLPVVRNGTRQLEGIISRQDIMQAYNLAIQKKIQQQHNAERIRLNTLTGAHVLEYRVERGSVVEQRHIQDIEWPPEAVVASIQRRGRLIVPHGSTLLVAGDVLTVVADRDSELMLNELFKRRVDASESI